MANVGPMNNKNLTAGRLGLQSRGPQHQRPLTLGLHNSVKGTVQLEDGPGGQIVGGGLARPPPRPESTAGKNGEASRVNEKHREVGHRPSRGRGLTSKGARTGVFTGRTIGPPPMPNRKAVFPILRYGWFWTKREAGRQLSALGRAPPPALQGQAR